MADPVASVASIAFLLLAASLPWSIAPISIAVVSTAALTLAVWWRPGGALWTRTPVDLPALGWLCALVLAAAFAQDPAASWPRVAKGLLLLLVPVAAYHARDAALARRALAALFVSTGVAAIYALGRFVAQGPAFPNRVRGAVGHPLTYGGQVMLVAALATAVAVRGRGRWRWGALALLALLLPALAGSYTRSAWIGYLAATAFIVAFVRARLLAFLAVGVAALVAILPGGYRERALSVFDPSNPWNAQRVHMWEAGLRMFRDHPWTGVGLQDLHTLYERYKASGATEPAGHLHSVYVHVAATMGALGLLALAWLIAGLWRAASRGLRASRDLRGPRRGLGSAIPLGVSAGLIGFFVSGLMEWNLGDEELLDLLCVLVGIAFAAAGWPREVNPSAPSRSGDDTTPPNALNRPVAGAAAPRRE